MLKLSDIHESAESFESIVRRPRGCLVTRSLGVLLFLLAVALAVGVGLLVHFVAKSDCSSPSEPPTTEPPPSADVRLPSDLLPELYTLELRPDIYGPDPAAFKFYGNVTIVLNCMKSTNLIRLHVNQLTIDDSWTKVTDVATSGSIRVISWDEDKTNQFLNLHLESSLSANKQYTVSLTFTGPLKDDLAGLYVSSYNESGQIKRLAVTQMEPTDARKSFPCFDEPALKAKYRVTLLRKAPMKSLSNMPQEKSVTRMIGGVQWIADIYQESVKMSTYLVAFLISEFEAKCDNTTTGIQFCVWARPSALGQVDYALHVGTKVLEHYETFYNVSFPLPKQDMVAVPDFAAGAMENWGLITYRETALLYDPVESAASNKQRVAVVIAHELAHQWFGNLVTMNWWDDLWLNEGFASYVEYLGTDFVEPEWGMRQQFVTEDLQYVFNFDGLSTSHPIYVKVYHPDEINEIFDTISYSKGASVIRMLDYVLGTPTFTKGLTRYLRNHEYANAGHNDLWSALNEQALLDNITSFNVTKVMDTWLLQMGYPVVTVQRQPFNNKTKLYVSQKHFLFDPSKPPSDKYPSPFNYTWEVPFTYATNLDEVNFTSSVIWMNKGDVSITIPDQSASWVLGNVGQYGYYRVNYDDDNWKALFMQLQSDHQEIHETNRAQIIDDSMNLGRSGFIDQTYGLEATKYLLKETNFLPWRAATINLDYISLMLQRSSAFPDFKRYMLNVVTPLYNQLGWSVTDLHLEKLTRVIAVSLACSYGSSHCANESLQLFDEWMNHPENNTIDPNIRTTVYCSAIRNGSQTEWDFAFNQYKISNVASEQIKILNGLSCSSNENTLSRYLNISLEGKDIRLQDAVSVIVYISNNPLGRSLVWNYVRDNWESILSRFGGGSFSFSNLISGITKSFNTEDDLKELIEFGNQYPDMGSGTRAYQQAIEKTNTNIKWMKKNEKKIMDWLSFQQ